MAGFRANENLELGDLYGVTLGDTNITATGVSKIWIEFTKLNKY